MESIEYIDNYFKGEKVAEETTQFERRVLTDKDFAEQVSFYLSTLQVAREKNNEERKSRFKKIYDQGNVPVAEKPVRRLWPAVALVAALLATVFVGIYFFNQQADPSILANNYIHKQLNTLGVQMGGNSDLMQEATNQYNQKNYTASLSTTRQLLAKDASNYDAIELTGLNELQLGNYDEALGYFQKIAANNELTENRGKFYQALTLMKRNLPADKDLYLQLLQEVSNEKLFGQEEARAILNKLK